MRNLPTVVFRLTFPQREACETEAARLGTTVNALAREALLDRVAPKATHVHAPSKAGRIGGSASHVEYDDEPPREPPRGEG